VRQLVVIGTVLLAAACGGPQPLPAMPPTEPSAAVQLGSPLTGAGASSADTGEIKPADLTTFNERASYSPYASRIDAERPYVEDEHADNASSVDVSGCGATRGLDESTHSARDEHIASTNERAETRPQE